MNFKPYTVPAIPGLFEKLWASARFETSGKGRQGCVLVNCADTRGVPIVRTTTKYHLPAQLFQPIHLEIAQLIQQSASLQLAFNNALFESYTDQYKKMGFHSDQAQDLEDSSSIAIFTCYQHPELAPTRKLIIEPKESGKEKGGEAFEITLEHSSVVIFSLDTNRHFKHKIVLDSSTKLAENQWLGITYRTSKTFVQHQEDGTYFENGERLTLATEAESSEFYPLRRSENNEPNFVYPKMTYTLSESDLLTPMDLIVSQRVSIHVHR